VEPEEDWMERRWPLSM